MISFIVTTYNLEDWLLYRCLDSIVSQGLPRDQYEVVIVDDESIVSPQHVVDRYVPNVNITLYVQKHARQGAARNVGIRYAKGEWIQFVDGDDYLFPGALPFVLKAAQEKDLDLLVFGFREVYDESPGKDICPGAGMVLSPITTGNEYMSRSNLFGACWRQIFKRQLLDDPTFGEPLRFTEGIYIEDEEFVTKLVWRARRMAQTATPVYAYYQRMGSTVHFCGREHADELFRNYFIVLERLLDFEATIALKPHDGITRKVRFLALDILRRALREPDWRKRWGESTELLCSLRLWPLPVARYSWKYGMFRLLGRCDAGRCVFRIIEKHKRL